VKRLDDRTGGAGRFREYDADTLRAFQQFDDDGRPFDLLDTVRYVFGLPGEEGRRHTHIVPASFPAYAGRHANVRWPQMEPGPTCRHCNVMIAGKVFRTVTDECWSLDRRLEAMAKSRVARQVLSPMPELLSYWLEPEDAQALGRHVNDTIATMVDEGGGRAAGGNATAVGRLVNAIPWLRAAAPGLYDALDVPLTPAMGRIRTES